MTVKVTFRGPCLYLNRGKVAEMVWLPDGLRVLKSDNGKKERHPDGTDASPHFAGLVVFEGKEGETVIRRLSLRGKVVTIGTGTEKCKTTASYDQIVPIDEVANDGHKDKMRLIRQTDPRFNQRVTTKVKLRGGSLASDVESPAKFEMKTTVGGFGKSHRIPLSATWSLPGTETTIRLQNRDGTEREAFVLKSSQRAVIYNWDSQEPTQTELLDPPKGAEGVNLLEDVDFKWLYEAFDPPKGKTFTQWLSDTGENSLRVPLTKSADTTVKVVGPTNPGSTGCDSARASLE